MLLRGLLQVVPSRCSSGAASTRAVLSFDAIPGPKPLPLIGNIWRYLPLIGDYDIDDLYKNAVFNRRKYGPIVREQITKEHVVLHLFDSQDVGSFFRLDGATPHRRSHRALLKFRRDNPGRYNDGGIFPENGAKWARLRTIFNPSLMKKSQVELRTSILDNITRQIVARLASEQSGAPVTIDDLVRWLHIWTIKCALSVFLDYSWASMPEQQVLDRILDSLEHLLDAIAGAEMKSQTWETQPSKCPYYQKLSKAETFTYEFVQQRIEHLLATNSFSQISYVRDWLSYDQLDRKDVITFVLDCLLASVHTTAYTTAFLLRNISSLLDERIRSELQHEIDGSLPSMSDSIERDNFEQMPLLRDCLKETLRLNPVSIGTGRVTQHDMVIRNYQIPSKVMVIAHNQLICRDSSLYKDPDRFCPSRWSGYRAESRSKRPSGLAWLPFGFGPRVCIGQHLVNLQIKILAARVLQNFDLSFLGGELKTKTKLVHYLDGKIPVQLTSRRAGLADVKA